MMRAKGFWERWLALTGVLAFAYVLASGQARAAEPQRLSAPDRNSPGSTEPGTASAGQNEEAGSAQLVIIDTDIGDDIDDAFAIALALQSPEIRIVGITTAWGNTPLRARLLERFLRETGHADVPVAVGVEKYPTKGILHFTQEAYAQRGPGMKLPDAVDFLLDQIRNHPGEISLIAIGPETNLGALIDRDAETFRKLKRVVLMGGSVYRGYDGFAYPTVPPHAEPEWNILCDPAAAEKVFTSGVPLYVMPLDSTQIKLEELERARLFSRGTALTDALTILYHQWAYETKLVTPTMFDAVAMAYTIRPELCPTKPLRLSVEQDGSTAVVEGEPNVQVCLVSDSDRFLEFYMERVAGK
ncbi:MAG TPA: nucleoside hydrolase [Candidatus Eremiobacteraceae bacterium]|nr:nucleoside hydrolase [Candidatus Eremiobacteraceae bacterium]